MGISSSSDKNASKQHPNVGHDEHHGGIIINRKGSESPRERMLLIGSPIDSPHPLSSPIKIRQQPPAEIVASTDNHSPAHNQPITTEQQFPTVFSWKHGGHEIYLSGTFNGWKERIPMQQSHGDFTCIQTLPPGTHYYRFIVDGKWQTDPGLPMITDANGEVNNILEIKPQNPDSLLSTGNVNASPPGSYGQEIRLPSPPKIRTVPGSSASQTLSQSPPFLPPHLLRALLNTAPTSEKDPSLLPLPHHVMLNHFYSLPREEDKVLILGVTQRYKTKFVTTVFYKPLILDDEDDEVEDLSPRHHGDEIV